MQWEFHFLYLYLVIGVVLGPICFYRWFLNKSRTYLIAHLVSMIVLLIGISLEIGVLVFIWPLFCGFGLLLYLKNHYKDLFSISRLATLIPFIFSIIASVWLVAAENELRLLGYNKSWSLYASLHGHFLGWIFVAGLAKLSLHKDSSQKLYTTGSFLCLVSFLLIAFGIDGVPYIKRIGVVALSVFIPLVLLRMKSHIGPQYKVARWASAFCFSGVLLSLGLAVVYEFGRPLITPVMIHAPVMVSTHGLINAFVVIPAFAVAIDTYNRD